jgi:inorganic pyrophosphatase
MQKDMQKVNVYVEIEKGSNVKYEFNKETNRLEIDRILPEPFHYPYCYGFIPNTLAKDGDELDALILTDVPLKHDQTYEAYIVGVLIMEDEKGQDEKILCVLPEDSSAIKDIQDIPFKQLTSIHTFFTNYKKTTPNKWSKVEGFETRKYAKELYEKSRIP